MQELQTKLDVIEIRKQLGQEPVDDDEDQPEKPIMPMSIFGMSGPMSLPMSMNNIAQSTVKKAKMSNLTAINQMQELLQELVQDQDAQDNFSPNISIGGTSQLSMALQKSDFGSSHEVMKLMKEKKYFELLQKSLKALTEIQKLEMNRSRFSDMMGSMIMPESPKRDLVDSIIFDKTLLPKVKESSRSMLELRLENTENIELRDVDNLSSQSVDGFDDDENVIRYEEEYESDQPTEGDTLTFYKLHKKRIADRSGAAMPEIPQKEKQTPLRSPTIFEKGDIKKNVQPTKQVQTKIESIVTLDENLESVTEQDNEDKSTPRTNFSQQTPPVMNKQDSPKNMVNEEKKEKPLQELNPLQSNPNLKAEDTEVLDFSPVGKVKESSIKKETVIPQSTDIDLSNVKQKTITSHNSARGIQSPSDLKLESNDILSEKNQQNPSEKQQETLVEPEQKVKQATPKKIQSPKFTPEKKDQPKLIDEKKGYPRIVPGKQESSKVTPDKKEPQESVAKESEVLQPTPQFKTEEEESKLPPVQDEKPEPNKENETEDFLKNEPLQTPKFKDEGRMSPIKKIDYLTFTKVSSGPKQKVDPDKSISEISNSSWRQTSIIRFEGKRKLHVESSSDDDVEIQKEINTSFNPIKEFFESSPAPKTPRARSSSRNRARSSSRKRQDRKSYVPPKTPDIQTIVEAIDEISAIGKSPRSDSQQPIDVNALNQDMSSAVKKNNQSVMIHDVISNFSDVPSSPLFQPVRTSKRFANKDYLNITLGSNMSSGKKLRTTPRTKFDKIEALRTPILVKKTQEKEKEEKKKLSQSMMIPAKNSALQRFKPKIPTRNTLGSSLNQSFSQNQMRKQSQDLNMTMQIQPNTSLLQTQKPKKKYGSKLTASFLDQTESSMRKRKS